MTGTLPVTVRAPGQQPAPGGAPGRVEFVDPASGTVVSFLLVQLAGRGERDPRERTRVWQKLNRLVKLRTAALRSIGRQNEDGQGVIEYGLILALVTLLAIATLNAPGAKMNEILMRAADSITSVS